MPSALLTRLHHYLELTPGERAAVEWLEHREKRFRAGEVVLDEGDQSDRLFVVKSGWMHSSTRLKSGDRQILRFHFPGDLTGTWSIAWAETAASLTAVSDSVVADFPRVALSRIFREQPRLAAMLYAVAAAEHVAMSDRLTSVGRTEGITRIATLLLDILSRLRINDPTVSDSFELPLRQADIGDAVGLTKVHVNRTLRDMEKAEMIERTGRTVRIVNPALLAEFAGFRDRHREIATDWLPQAA